MIPKLNEENIEVDKEYNHIWLVLLGDAHKGHPNFDNLMFEQNINWCVDNPNVYVITMGDLMECATKYSLGLFDQSEYCDEQIEYIINVLQPLVEEGRLLGMHPGNHEERIKKIAGLDITKLLCRQFGVKYYGEGEMHLINVKNDGKRKSQTYSMYTTHGGFGGTLPYTKMKACMDLSRIAYVELYGMAHTHALMHHKQNSYEIDANHRKIIERPRHYVLTGSYLRYWKSYAHRKGYAPAGDMGSPKIKLHIHKHRISVKI